MDASGRRTDRPSGSAVDAIQNALEPGEAITHAVPAIGSTIVLTDRRLLIVRDGSSFRPRTGIREWALVPGLSVRAGLVRQGTGSLVVHWSRDVTSVFVRSDRWDDALALVAALRGRLLNAADRERRAR
jgi:hypothetical protein